jgi:hypothetical protein
MARKVKTCECDGVCGHGHSGSSCGVPSGTTIARRTDDPSRWMANGMVEFCGGLDSMAVDNPGWKGATLTTSRVLPVGVRGKRVLLCTFCRHAWRARRAAEREEQRLARATRKPLYRRGVLR